MALFNLWMKEQVRTLMDKLLPVANICLTPTLTQLSRTHCMHAVNYPVLYHLVPGLCRPKELEFL